MTVETQVIKVTGNGNDLGTVFSFSPMKIFTTSNLVVTHVTAAGVETPLTEGVSSTNYSVAAASGSYPSATGVTGSITYPADEVTPLPTGESVVMKRVLTLEQQTDLENQGGYFNDIQETQFDKLVMIDQQQQDLLDRAIKLQVSTTGVDTELPEPVALRYLRFNSDADAIEAVALSTAVASASDVAALDVSLSTGASGSASDFAREDHVHTIEGVGEYAKANAFTSTNSFASTTAMSDVLTMTGAAVDLAEGAAIASTTTTEIWATDGNTVHITGTTTITSLGTAPQAGAKRTIIFDGALTLTNGANLILPGGDNIVTEAGDVAVCYADTTTQIRVTVYTPASAKMAGDLVQVVNIQDGALATGTTVTVDDDTIPQNTEGDEYMTLAITPKATANILIIQTIGTFAHSSATPQEQIMAIFQDTTADALAAINQRQHSIGIEKQYVLTHKMTAGTTSETTFKMRSGNQLAGTTTFNGAAGARKLGGVMASSITIWEIKI